MILHKTRYLIVVLLALNSVALSWASEKNVKVPDWENPQIISRNKVSGHAFIRPYASETNALNNKASRRIQSLNGKWKFNWVGHPDSRPKNFYRTDFDVSNWQSIDVPGNWQTQGFGRPIYTNHPYPFAKDQPRVMTEPPKDYTNFFDRNPVGSYKRIFTVGDGLKDKQIFIEFQGVKSAFYLWVNGKKVGYSQGSMTPAEFDITDYLVAGNNDLSVEVYRWSDGSYLEGQDMWRFSGIFRDVNLIARPEVFLQDYQIHTRLKNNYRDADLTIDFVLDGRFDKNVIKNNQLEISLFAPDGQLLYKKKATANLSKSKMSGKLQLEVSGINLWSAESPTLYPMLLTLTDNKGKSLEYIPWTLGFREVKIEDNQLWVNGRSIKIKGMNRHEHHPRTGRYIDTATMELDLKLLKQANLNLVRNSHYPNDQRWYRLAEQYGIYILDEANQESHAYKQRNKIIGDNPNWTKAHVDRAVSMVQTNKNYSAIVIWSLGNEGGSGRNFTAMREAVDAIDTSRPVFSDTDESASDIYDRSYRTTSNYKKELNKARKNNKPFMQREYAHAMGNSLGNFQEHWDIINANKDYIGASIWDWVDQGLAQVKNTAMVSYGSKPEKLTLNHEREVWSYGGDFGDRPTVAEFLLNGVVSPDRKPYPSYYEVKKVLQNVHFEQTDKPMVIKITNRYDFTNLSGYDIQWLIKDTEKTLAEGKLNVSLPAGQSTLLKVPFSVANPADYTELLLEFSVRSKVDTLWANKGFEVAYEQLVIKSYQFPEKPTAQGRNLKVNQSDDSITITTKKATLVIDRISGELTRYQIAGQELLVEPLAPYFWKPVNNNQGRNNFVERMTPWLKAAAYRKVSSVTVNKVAKNLLEINVIARLVANHALYTLTYRINGEGDVQISGDYRPDQKRIQNQYMPKFGMRMALDSSLSQINWYGRGPFENYPDRKTAAKIGNYQKTLETFQVPYISATDSTNRSDVRKVSFSNQKVQLTVEGLQPFNFRAWPYKESDLYSPMNKEEKDATINMVQRKHYYDLPERNLINVNLDLAIHGVGGDNSWGAKTMKKYHVSADKPLSFSFIIRITEKTD